MAYCRTCGAEIKFIKMKSGKWNPVDIQKRTVKKDGGKETLITEEGELIRGTFASVEECANGTGYISHFSTCPNASQFRKRGKDEKELDDFDRSGEEWR